MIFSTSIYLTWLSYFKSPSSSNVYERRRCTYWPGNDRVIAPLFFLVTLFDELSTAGPGERREFNMWSLLLVHYVNGEFNGISWGQRQLLQLLCHDWCIAKVFSDIQNVSRCFSSFCLCIVTSAKEVVFSFVCLLDLHDLHKLLWRGGACPWPIR